MIYLILRKERIQILLKKAAIYIGNWIWNQLSIEQKEKTKNNNMDLIEIQNRIKIVLLYIAISVTLLMFGSFTGMWIELALSLVSFAFIRSWNGGHHFSVDVCYIITISVILGAIPLSYIVGEYPTIVLVIALLLNLKLAPFKKDTKHHFAKKTISIILCVLSFYINDIFLTMWFLLGFDLIKSSKRTVESDAGECS